MPFRYFWAHPVYHTFLKVTELAALRINIILIQVDSQLTDPNFSESSQTQLTAHTFFKIILSEIIGISCTCKFTYTLEPRYNKYLPPLNITFLNISKSILPILIIQTVMDREFSYANIMSWCMSATIELHCFCEDHAFYPTKGVIKKSRTVL